MGKQIVLEGEGIATGYRQGKQVAEVHQGLDFSLSGGELTCLLGCNGAGKSTTMNIMCGVLKQTEGDVYIKGISAAPFVRPSGTHGAAFGGLQCA